MKRYAVVTETLEIRGLRSRVWAERRAKSLMGAHIEEYEAKAIDVLIDELKDMIDGGEENQGHDLHITHLIELAKQAKETT